MGTLVRRLGTVVVFGATILAAVPATAQEVSVGYQWQNVSIDDEFLDCCTAPFGINFDAAFQ